ncbi:MAG: hypothetical protein ACP5PN_09235 [Steroidobacteraceae bacterium]
MSTAAYSTRRRGAARRFRPRRAAPGWVGWLALTAFGLRALVPLGFDPNPHTLSIVLCHQGFPAGFFTHGAPPPGARGGRGGEGSSAHCLFCSSTSPAPPYTLAGVIHRAFYAVDLSPLRPPLLRGIRLAYTPQARAPPSPV